MEANNNNESDDGSTTAKKKLTKGKSKETKKKKKVKTKSRKDEQQPQEVEMREDRVDGDSEVAAAETSKKTKNPSKKAKLARADAVDEDAANATFKDDRQPDSVHIPLTTNQDTAKKAKAEKKEKKSKKNKESVVDGDQNDDPQNRTVNRASTHAGTKLLLLPKTPMSVNRLSRLSMIKQRLSTVKKSAIKPKPLTRRAAAAAAARTTTTAAANAALTSSVATTSAAAGASNVVSALVKPKMNELSSEPVHKAVHMNPAIGVTPQTQRKIGHIELIKNTASKFNKVFIFS